MTGLPKPQTALHGVLAFAGLLAFVLFVATVGALLMLLAVAGARTRGSIRAVFRRRNERHRVVNAERA